MLRLVRCPTLVGVARVVSVGRKVARVIVSLVVQRRAEDVFHDRIRECVKQGGHRGAL